MVVFTCNSCGDSVKRNQVQRHCERCRGCEMLSCIDCGKDFWGNDYEQHIKCISEEEKYSGKNYVAKPNANKNELRQQQWTERVQAACLKYKTQDYVKSLLERMKDYPNVPRTQKKFENFVKNCLAVRALHVPGILWKLLMVDNEKDSSEQSKTTSTDGDKSVTKGDNSSTGTNSSSANNVLSEQSDVQSKTLNKRERKEERRKKAHKMEKKEKHMNGTQEESSEPSKKEKKSKKKRKHDSDEDDGLDMSGENEQPEGESMVEEEAEEPQRKRFKTKFNWEENIRSVLESKGAEMKIKKVRKKVLAEYLAQGCSETSEEKLWAKFDKKLKKNPTFKVLNDRVKLVS